MLVCCTQIPFVIHANPSAKSHLGCNCPAVRMQNAMLIHTLVFSTPFSHNYHKSTYTVRGKNHELSFNLLQEGAPHLTWSCGW